MHNQPEEREREEPGPAQKCNSTENKKAAEEEPLPDVFWDKGTVTGFIAVNNRATELEEGQPIFQNTPLKGGLLSNNIWEGFSYWPHPTSPGRSISTTTAACDCAPARLAVAVTNTLHQSCTPCAGAANNSVTITLYQNIWVHVLTTWLSSKHSDWNCRGWVFTSIELKLDSSHHKDPAAFQDHD